MTTSANIESVDLLRAAFEKGVRFEVAMERVWDEDKKYRHELEDIWRGWKNGRPFAHLHADVLWG
jgi:hypothetical protein